MNEYFKRIREKNSIGDYIKPFKLENGKFTFKNIKTGKVYEQIFDYADVVEGGFARVQIDGKWTFFDPSTGKLCEQRFDSNYRVHDDIAYVEIDGKWTLFNPKDEFVFSARFAKYVFSVEECIRQYPEEFEHLPTDYFYETSDTTLIKRCLCAVAEGIKDCTKERQKQIQTIILNKLKKERDNLKKENCPKITKINARKATKIIKNPGKTLV